jgi:hypothetical protein
MEQIEITVQGTAPLLMHNGRLSNPIDPATKELKRYTGKRQKTDEDHEAVARFEHAGSLYMDSDVGPYIPGENFQRCLLDAAKMSKKGQNVIRGVFVNGDVNPISYNGPRTTEGLWADTNFRHMASVKVGTARVMRCRPVFREWRCAFVVTIDTTQIEVRDLLDIAETGGMYKGLGDWRPRFGRFAVIK